MIADLDFSTRATMTVLERVSLVCALVFALIVIAIVSGPDVVRAARAIGRWAHRYVQTGQWC